MRQLNSVCEWSARACLATALLVMLQVPAQALVAQTRVSAPVVERARGAGFSIDTSDRLQVIAAYQKFVQSPAPASEWTGDVASCTPGTTSEAYKTATLQRLNFFRAMAGVPADVAWQADYNAKAQQAALMISANRKLEHQPAATWACYTDDGRTAAGNSNLALGVSGPSAIDLYMRDPGDTNSAVPHRRWLLYPQTQHMGTGDIPDGQGGSAANSLWVFDALKLPERPATRETFVAWPPPGYVPQPLVYARWSFSLANADFSSASVVMRTAGVEVPLVIESATADFGEKTLVWVPQALANDPNWSLPAGGSQTYQVSVNHVGIDGQTRDFAYEVIVIDPAVSLPDEGTATPIPSSTAETPTATPTVPPVETPTPTEMPSASPTAATATVAPVMTVMPPAGTPLFMPALSDD